MGGRRGRKKKSQEGRSWLFRSVAGGRLLVVGVGDAVVAAVHVVPDVLGDAVLDVADTAVGVAGDDHALGVVLGPGPALAVVAAPAAHAVVVGRAEVGVH